MKGMSLKRVWIFLVEPLGSQLLELGRPMRQIYSSTTLLSCASPMPLFPLLGCQGREGKAVYADWSALVRVTFVLVETGTKVGWSVHALGDNSLMPNSFFA